MAGGGGGGQSVTTQEIPSELKPLASAFTNSAISLNNTPWQAYGGQRFAGFTPSQQAGLGMMENRALTNGTIGNAESALNQTIQGQTNPYLDAMVNKAQASVLGNANAAAARSGSFGNSGIAEQAAKQMGDVATSMYGGAYENDAARRMQAIGMAPTINQAGFQNAQQLFNAGQIRQDQAQQGLDFQYQQSQERANDPYKKLAAMSGVFGTNLGGTTTTQQSGGGK